MVIKDWKLIFQVVIATTIVLVVFKFSYLAENNESIRNFVSHYGYGGLFAVSLVSGFNLLIPVPAISFLPLFLISGLSLWPAVLVIVLGTTLADVTAYIIGAIGKRVVKSSTGRYTLERLEKLRLQHYWMPVIVLFLFAAFVPLPNEIIMVPLGFLGYRLTYLLPALFMGNGVFNILYAFGVISFFNTYG